MYISSLACPYDCGYCTNKGVYGRKWNALEPDQVVEETTDLVLRYRLQLLWIVDDNFLVDRERALGIAVIELGGGRRVASDRIDHAVGLTALAGRSAHVGHDQPLCVIHARDEASLERAARMVRRAYRLGDMPVLSSPVLTRIGPETA